MALKPQLAETNGHSLAPDALAFLASWQQFGAPVSIGGLGGMVDRRADYYLPRQAWLDRNVRAKGLDPKAWETIWAALDHDAILWTSKQLKKDSDAGI